MPVAFPSSTQLLKANSEMNKNISRFIPLIF